MKNQESIFVPMERDGQIPTHIVHLTLNALSIDRHGLDNIFSEGRKGLDHYHIYVVENEWVNLFFFSQWTEARYTGFHQSINFINQQDYDERRHTFHSIDLPYWTIDQTNNRKTA